MLIALSGTPGTGKTAVAKVLAKKLTWRLIELNKLAEKNSFFCGYDKERKTKIADVGKIKKRVTEIAKKEKNLIIESHYAHEIPSDVTIILRCDMSELKKRMEKKGWRKEKIKENLQAEIFQVCGEEARQLKRKVVEVDTTGKSPTQVAEEIVQLLKKI